MPALGPSFGIAPAGTCTWNERFSNAFGSTPSSSACERTYESAMRADSFITSPSWPVSMSSVPPSIEVASTNSTSPPVPVTASPVATPGTAVRSAASWNTFWRPSASRTTSMSTTTGGSTSAGRDLRRRLAEDLAELTLELADAGLARVLGDHRLEHVVVDRRPRPRAARCARAGAATGSRVRSRSSRRSCSRRSG